MDFSGFPGIINPHEMLGELEEKLVNHELYCLCAV